MSDTDQLSDTAATQLAGAGQRGGRKGIDRPVNYTDHVRTGGNGLPKYRLRGNHAGWRKLTPRV